MFFEIGVLKNFAVFTGKHQRWSLFLIKLQTWMPTKRLQHSCFPVNIAKFSRTPFLKNTSDDCICKMMKFYKDICWLFFSQDDVKWVVKTQKYLQSVEMYFYGYFLTKFFITPRRAEAITYENFVPAERVRVHINNTLKISHS